MSSEGELNSVQSNEFGTGEERETSSEPQGGTGEAGEEGTGGSSSGLAPPGSVPSEMFLNCYETDLYPRRELAGNDPLKAGRTVYWDNPTYKKLKKDYCTSNPTGGIYEGPVEGNYLVEYYVERSFVQTPMSPNAIVSAPANEPNRCTIHAQVYGCSCKYDSTRTASYCEEGTIDEVVGEIGSQEEIESLNQYTFIQRIRNFFTRD